MEAALGFLGSYTELGGSFLARRFRQEAWPQLQRLLQRGPDTPLNASEPLAPAVVHRAQLAVVTYLQRCAGTLRVRMPLQAPCRFTARMPLLLFVEVPAPECRRHQIGAAALEGLGAANLGPLSCVISALVARHRPALDRHLSS